MNTIENILDKTLKRYPELELCRDSIWKSFGILTDCFGKFGKLLCCGNGGSAADCDHIVGELMKSFHKKRPISKEHIEKIEKIFPETSQHLHIALPAINLASQMSIMTAYINDCEPTMIYAQLLYGYARTGDVLICLSTSGNSKNILAAAKVAKAIGIKVIGLTGKDGGLLKEYCDSCISVPQIETHLVQELHLPVYHTLCAMLEEWLLMENRDTNF